MFIILGIIAVLIVIACILALFQRKAKEQPARESYFFSKSFQDLKSTIKLLWSKNKSSASKKWIIGRMIIYLLGGMVTLITTVMHVSLIGCLFLFVYTGFALVWLIDNIYTSINKIATACPNPECQAKFTLPIYECPECGEKHDHLSPGKYGILKRTCVCGQKLPATFLNGRGRLKAYCPRCMHPLSGGTSSRQYAIPVVGGPSVGKTCYIHMTIDQLMKKTARENNWNIGFLNAENEQEYFNVVNAMKQGTRPQKTDFNKLNAYQLELSVSNDKVSRRIYFYDIAGESFQSSSMSMLENHAFSFADGYIFMIDPLTIGAFEAEVLDHINVEKYGVSTDYFEDVFDMMLINLEKLFPKKGSDKLRKNLAIVINKCDIPKLNQLIGDARVKEYMAATSECTSYAQAKNAVCKEFLIKYGCNGFVRKVDERFRNVQYFSCSSLGHNDEGHGYEGIDVEKPFVWILNQVDSAIHAKVF